MSPTKFVYGFHAITSYLRQNPENIAEIYVDNERQDLRLQKLLAAIQESDIRVLILDGHRLDGMVGHDKHQGVVAKLIAPPSQYHHIDDVLEDLQGPALLLILDGVQDPHNLGACLRVADGLGVHAVIAPKDRAVGVNATVRKVASGAAEVVPYIAVTNLARTLRELKERGIWLIGAAVEADTPIWSIDLAMPTAWVLGAEGRGLRRLTREHCDTLCYIPMFGSVESLNVSAASALCLYETQRQRAAAMDM